MQFVMENMNFDSSMVTYIMVHCLNYTCNYTLIIKCDILHSLFLFSGECDV